jgi:hypothetical protein
MALSKITNESLSAGVQTAMTTDLSPLKSDILKLALHQAIDGNRVAYNLEDSFIDGFEDDTGITTETNVDRDTSGEHITTATLGTSVYVTGNRTSSITITGSHLGNIVSGSIANWVDGNTTSNSTHSWYWDNGVAIADRWFQFDFGSVKVITEMRYTHSGNNSGGIWQWQGSNDASSWTNIGGTWEKHNNGGGSNLSGTDTVTTMNSNATAYRYYRMLGISGTGSNPWEREIEFKTKPLTVGATGTLISDPQTASTSRTSASGVIIYEDAAGTNTLGTDLKIYFSCNNSAWTEASSYGTAATYSGSKKLVKLGATTCTAGTSIAMKAVWANQAASVAGGYETGDRRSTITVTDTGFINDGDGPPSNLVNGSSATNGSSHACTSHVQATSGQYMLFAFSTAKIISECRWIQQNGHSGGVWKWQGSNDNSTYTDIGTSFTLGNSQPSQLHTELNGNTTAYTYYRLFGVSGNTQASDWIREVEFKTASVTGKEARLHGWAVNY